MGVGGTGPEAGVTLDMLMEWGGSQRPPTDVIPAKAGTHLTDRVG